MRQQKQMTSPGQRLLRPSLDPAGFSLKGVVPYGWQPLGQRYEVPVTGAHGSNIQVLGFEGRDGAKHGYRHKGYVTIETVIEVFNDYCQTINEPTVVVLDNASCHTSGEFQANLMPGPKRGFMSITYRHPVLD